MVQVFAAISGGAQPWARKMYLVYRTLLLSFLLVLPVSAAIAPAAAKPAVDSVRVGEYATKTRFVVDLSQSVPFKIFTLADPYRVVVDLPEVVWHLKPEEVSDGKRVTGYRFGLFQAGQSRIVIDTAKPVRVAKAFMLEPTGRRGHRLVIDLADENREAFMRALQSPGAAPGQESAREDRAVEQDVAPVPPRKPNELPMIAIDPGHGGVDPGARGVSGTWEKDLTLLQARELRRQLLQHGRYRVVMTRNSDVFVRLRERIAIAQRAGADIFISLHADSIANGSVRGGAVYTLSEQASDREAAALAAKENKADIIAGIDLNDQSRTVAKILIDLRQRLTKNESVTFAKALVNQLDDSMRLLRNNHRFAGFAVLKAPDIPSVLIELGYLSNRIDERLLRRSRHRTKVASAIVKAIDGYFARQQALHQP